MDWMITNPVLNVLFFIIIFRNQAAAKASPRHAAGGECRTRKRGQGMFFTLLESLRTVWISSQDPNFVGLHDA